MFKNIFTKSKNGTIQKKISKIINTSTSVKNVKNSLLDLHWKETAKINKHEEEKEIQKSFPQNSDGNLTQQINQESQNFLINDNHESSVIPKELPFNCKKFIEIKTKEVIYLTPDGKIYTEDKSGKLEKLENITSMAPKNKMNSPIQRKSLAESQSVPMIAPVEKTFSRPENLNLNEPMLPFPTTGMQSPFIFPSPSVHFDNCKGIIIRDSEVLLL